MKGWSQSVFKFFSMRTVKLSFTFVILMFALGCLSQQNRVSTTDRFEINPPDGDIRNVKLLIDPTTPVSVTGGNDLAHFQYLASGVGWEFEPNAETTARLREIGIQSLRHINVDIRTRDQGFFDSNGKFIITNAERLDKEFNTVREIGTTPHIILGLHLHEDLIVTVDDIPPEDKERFMGLLQNTTFGPNDYGKFQNYLEAVFEYVLITQGFPSDRFELGNEPDIGGTPHPFPPKPAMGTKALYDGYFELYRAASKAARNVEMRNPGIKVQLGGPALSWAFTFRFGDFNWLEKFLYDVNKEQLKLDFISVHYYGNHSSLKGEYTAGYPPFTKLLETTFAARDKYTPGVPVWITEWGPSYHTKNVEYAMVNANNIGAAWAVKFIDLMLESGIDGALYLVTTDLRQAGAGGNWENVWGWPSLFVNPHVFGKPYPKALYHVFDMISRLEGERISAEIRWSDAIGSFVTLSEQNNKIMALVWNSDYQIIESKPGIERGEWVNLNIELEDVRNVSNSKNVRLERWIVSETISNALYLYTTEGKVDSRAELQKVEDRMICVKDEGLAFDLIVPPSSVSLIVLSWN
jgi:hypothetical protein